MQAQPCDEEPTCVRLYGDAGAVAADVLARRDEVLRSRFPAFGDDTLGTDAQRERVRDTLLCILHELRQGILVTVRHGHVRLVAVVANSRYRDRVVAARLRFLVPGEGGQERPVSVAAYRRHKARLRPDLRVESWVDADAWWASNGILCQVNRTLGWGLGMLPAILADLRMVCGRYRVPDQDFVLNRRDAPMLPADGAHPYWFAGARFLTPHRIRLPVLSFYGGAGFLDRPLITPDPALRPRPCDWGSRAPVAFFRGTLTGHGTTAATNVRLAVAWLSEQHPDLVDAGIIRLSPRDKVWNAEVRFDDPNQCPAPRDPVPMEAWTRYRYLLYCAGHSAALRLEPMLAMRSVVIMVRPDVPDPRAADRLWFHGYLRCAALQELPDAAATAHVVSAPVADLPDVVRYLRDNDGVARRLAENAAELHATLQDHRAAFMARELGAPC